MTEEKKSSKEEEKKSDTAKTKTDEKVEIPKKFKGVIEEIEKMSVLDLAELVTILEDKFNVSAAAPVAMAAAPVDAVDGEGSEAEKKSEYDIEITSAGESKIAVIKVVKEITEKGLKEAKDLVDAAPKVIKEKVAKEEAEELKKKLEEAGATIELK